jgi:hypothetical protein
VAKTPGTQLLRVRRKAEERVDLAVDKQLLGPNGTAGDPVDLRLWVDPHIGSDQRQEQMLGRSHRSEADLLAAEIGDAAYLFAREQPEAPDMHPGQKLDRGAAINVDDLHRAEIMAEVDYTTCDRVGLVDLRFERHVSDVGEAFGAQEVGDDICRSAADALVIGQPHGGRLERCFRRE